MSGQLLDAGDVADDYMRFRSGDGASFSSTEHHLVYSAASELFEGDTLEAYASVELDGDPWVLIVAAESGAAILRLHDDRVETWFLGRLRGTYREEWRMEDTGGAVTILFEDERLPGGSLKLAVPAPRSPGSFPDSRDARRRTMIAAIRKRLREWATQPTHGTQ